MKFIVCMLLFLFISSCQINTTTNNSKFNLDFEVFDQLQKFPEGWYQLGNYSIDVDTLITYSGKFSGKIKSSISNQTENSFGFIAYNIPANYTGKIITLEGYMKTKNIENGFAGLLLRIDGENEMLDGENMQNQNIHGTNDWKKYSITLPYPENAENICIGGIMTGLGEVWFDNFTLTIDSENIQTLKEKEKTTFQANLDKEFDLSSDVVFPTSLDDSLIRNIELLGKVWGFLKYHHPAISKGNYNWDYELFRILPKYLKINNLKDRDKTILQWIEKYGKIVECKNCKNMQHSNQLFIKPDLSWFEDYRMSIELKESLMYIYENRNQGKHFYINIGQNPYSTEFLNEQIYYSMSYNDEGFKLLALYRYWNIINYFYPYKYLTDKEWKLVLRKYIPIFINSKNKLEYEIAFVKLIGEINDTHATTSIGLNNLESIRGNFHPPFQVKFIENKLIVTDYFNPELKDISKISIGDIITAINDIPVQAIVDSIKAYYPASNEASRMRDISKDLLRSKNSEVAIDYVSNGVKKYHKLPLYKEENLNKKWYKWSNEKCYKFLEGNIGYINLETITENDIPNIKETFKNTKGIVIDIRNYPSTLVAFSLGSYFVSQSTPFVKFTVGNINHPGEFNLKKGEEIPKPIETYKGKLVVLVNEASQSQAEYTAMAFRAGDNTTIVGSTTAGADGNVSSIYFPGGLLTRISGIGVYYPDGGETQRVGIIPDVVVTPTIEGIKKGKDELLEKAIQIINK